MALAAHRTLPATTTACHRPRLLAFQRCGSSSAFKQTQSPRRDAQCCASSTGVQQLLVQATAKPVTAEVEKTSWTSRRLFAQVVIQAPLPVVWSCLTDYDGLGDFIPSLQENKCLQRKSNGAVIRQVGAQEVAMGVNFSAACTLDCTEYVGGVPTELCATTGDGKDGLLPYPKNSMQGLHTQDITFEQVEGDFQSFRGVWRMQACQQNDQQGNQLAQTTLLCYSLYVQPKAWLPVGLIQDRIEKEVVRNLEAIRQYAERLHHGGRQQESGRPMPE